MKMLWPQYCYTVYTYGHVDVSQFPTYDFGHGYGSLHIDRVEALDANQCRWLHRLAEVAAVDGTSGMIRASCCCREPAGGLTAGDAHWQSSLLMTAALDAGGGRWFLGLAAPITGSQDAR